jgi:hypothetical protein
MFQPIDIEAVSHVSKADSSLGVSSAMAYLFVYDVLVVGTLAFVSLVAGKGDNATTPQHSVPLMASTKPTLCLHLE